MKAKLESLFREDDNSFRCRMVRETMFHHALHYHPEIEITLIRASGGTRIVGDHVGPFKPGDLCMIGENLPHCYHQSAPSPGGSEAEVLQFSRHCAGGFLGAAAEMRGFVRLIDRARIPPLPK